MRDWKGLLIRPETTLSQVIEILDKKAQRIVLITDSLGHLLGTVTDGDIRRALIRHISLDLPISEIMCRTPKTAREDWSKELILSTLESHQLLHIPVVDSKNRIIGLETLYDILCKPRHDNPVFLIAGGLGTRLYPLTKSCPKPLLKVGEKPILELIIERFIAAGFHKFFISTHFMPEKIMEHFNDGSQWGVDINYVHEDNPLGTGGALGLLPAEQINLPVIMMNGDLLTDLNFEHLLSFYESQSCAATMGVRKYEYSVPFGVIQNNGNLVTSMVEKPIQRFFINAGIYVLSPQLVQSVASGVRIDMPTLLDREITKGHKVTMFPIHEYWLDIGRMDDFQRAQTDIDVLSL